MTGDYLWDRSGWPDPEIQRLERVLEVFRYQPPEIQEVRAQAAAPSRGALWTWLAAAAAVVAIIVAPRVTPSGSASLQVKTLAGTPTIASVPMADSQRLHVGNWLETNDASRASIDVNGVGRVEVEHGTRIGLLSTRPGDYRLHLARGTMQAVIWAPAGQFSVKTPSSTAVDLGCVYSMTVDDDDVGLIRVAVGWVGFEWKGRESFIPAGAVCLTRPALGPGTPHFDDTSDAFKRALTTIDVGGSPTALSAALTVVLTEARQRDVVTLWHLLSRVDPRERDRVFDRLAGFVAPPASVTREGIKAGRRDMLDAWWDGLNLGTSVWWRMWKQQWRENSAQK